MSGFFDLFGVPALIREALFQIYVIKREVLGMSEHMNELMDRVTAIESAGDAAIALLQGLKTQLDDAIESGDSAALQELSDRLGQQTQELADAIVANTPVDLTAEPTDPDFPIEEMRADT